MFAHLNSISKTYNIKHDVDRNLNAFCGVGGGGIG